VNHNINEWRHHLSASVDAEGRHFEHYLRLLASKYQCRNGRTVNLITGNDFLSCFAVNINEQRMIVFLTEKCCFYKLTK